MVTLYISVSNEVPEHPCVSPVSSCVFERRLIEKYIAENGVDPITNEVLTEEQLIDIKGSCEKYIAHILIFIRLLLFKFTSYYDMLLKLF